MKLLLCFFASCFDSMWAECARTGECNDTARKEFFRCFAATIVSNNFDIKNIYIFVLRHQSEAATAARQNYSRIALRWLVGREPVSCGVFYALQGQVSTRPWNMQLAAMHGDVAQFHLGPAAGGWHEQSMWSAFGNPGDDMNPKHSVLDTAVFFPYV